MIKKGLDRCLIKEDIRFSEKPKGKFLDLSDKTYNNLRVLGFAGMFNSQSFWWCGESED